MFLEVLGHVVRIEGSLAVHFDLIVFYLHGLEHDVGVVPRLFPHTIGFVLDQLLHAEVLLLTF